MLVLEIALTDACNLGCVYCYVRNKKSKLSIKRLEDFYYHDISPLLARFGETEYCVSLFGGEPLMAIPELKKCVGLFKQDPNCKYIVLISNLLLLTEHLRDWIKNANIGVSWSCDGISNTRPTLSGDTTIGRYLKIKDLVTSLTNSVKSIVTPDNVKDMVENAQWFKDYGMTNINFQYIYDPVWDVNTVAKYDKELIKLGKWWLDNLDTELSIFTNVYRLLYSGSGKVTPCFAGTSGVCLATNGEIYGCQRYAQTGERVIPQKLAEICHDCPLMGKCLVGCSYSIQHHGMIPEVCALHRLTHKTAIELVKNPEIQKRLPEWINKKNIKR